MSFSNENLKELFLILLGKGLLDLFPRVKLVKGVISDYGLYYEFSLPDRFDHQSLKLMEEKLSLMIHEGNNIEKVTMLKENAVNFLMHHKQPLLAKQIENHYLPGLLTFYRFGTLLQPVDEHNEIINLSDLKFFKLMNFIELPNQHFRLYGCVHQNKNHLKNFLKNISTYSEKYHLSLGKDQELLSCNEEGHYWINKGLELLDIIYEEQKENLDESTLFFKNNLPTEENLIKQALNQRKNYFDKEVFCYQGQLEKECEDFEYQGLWRSKYYFTERVFLFKKKTESLEQLISSLQFIVRKDIISNSEPCWILPIKNEVPSKFRKKQEKLVNVLIEALQTCNFSYKFEKSKGTFSEQRAYLTYTDILGKSWKGPFVGLIDFDSNEEVIITQSLYGSLDRYIAYLLEKAQGGLPFSLAPEQVRLIVKDRENLSYANKVRRKLIKCNLRVKIDPTDNKLGMRIHVAEKEKIPYIAVIGKNEQLHQKITLRNFLGEKESEMTVDDFLQRLCNKEHLKKNVLFDDEN